MTGFPGSPRTLKGAIVAYAFPDLVPSVVVFQYNPETLTRSLSPRTSQGGGTEPQRADGPPEESISLTMEIDAADQLEKADPLAVSVGLHPVLAALEGLLYPPLPLVIANQALSLAGGAFIAGEPVPIALLIWGPARVLPVRVESISITEQAFDPNLNPILAKADVSLKVLTYRELEPSSPAYWVYMASFTQKEVMAALNLATGTGLLGVRLPI
ncbi:hypothetical protein GXW74_06700 [Roseomonas eburnea]|uniref:Uncharacterized protein n=1 Tax=Neoroseomonas eburnea TaxID=1346889 RepID=A0A9X9X8Y3_9PROT|nr:hypothetical protein [Neoroseomonas eburnea]MBR0680169.1 hypothetical protein [Neoroseomonas eburnea]